MLNQVVIQGRMVADAEVKTLSNGNPVTSFSVAVQRNFKNANGKYDADFIDCVSYEKTPFISKYFHKGSVISLVGELQTRTWKDEAGKSHKAYSVNVSKAYFDVGGSSNNSNNPATPTESVASDPDDAGELPFEQ